ncbi:DUF938 domain-containing protein [Salinimonas marina]|uniref:DUF938 domain-containing protein n=1 Tax=Salinimonas marina TaxID=2785918 RepID=A0A7S9DW29_9ALTE|nr:DUF938 domain-containing protein [Salinimonas marina]QPG04920.1 DUF938 domain-containing protein [Salinimonas marina]
MTKPFSQACENNRRPILSVLKQAFCNSQAVLEIGSGTGQHAVFFAKYLPHLQWYSSDQEQYHEGIQAWIDESPAPNLHAPQVFKVGEHEFPVGECDGVFTANTTHIMQPEEARLMMKLVEEALPEGGVFCQYGPFIENGRFNSQSNYDFHHKLQAQGYGGYQDIETLKAWTTKMRLKHKHIMPANNLLLEWIKAPR